MKQQNNRCMFERLYVSNKEDCRFPFWNISFRFRDIRVLYYAEILEQCSSNFELEMCITTGLKVNFFSPLAKFG